MPGNRSVGPLVGPCALIGCMRSLVALVTLVALAGCGAEDDSTRSTAQSPSTSPTRETSPTHSAKPRPGGQVVKVAGSDFGPMLFDASGQAIYLFDKETGSRPACYGACAEAWPPVLTAGAPEGQGKVRAALLGTTRRRDGSTQVTYAGHPLYYYAHEGKDQVLCHNVREYGGLWLVVTPGGEPAPA